MRYVSQLNEYSTAVGKKDLMTSDKNIVIFLINQKGDGSLGHNQDFEFYFSLKPGPDFEFKKSIILGFFDGKFGQLDPDLSPSSFKYLHYLEHALSNQLAVYLVQEFIHFPEEEKNYLEHMILSLGDFLVKRYCHHEEVCKSRTLGLSPYQVNKIHHFIRLNLEQSINTQDLAGLVDLSVHHFIRMFKRTTGETPHRCVNRLKMEHAKTLLLETSENIIQVGMGVGCDNPSHFSQLFKSNYGITPLKFRKAFKKTALSEVGGL